VDARGQSGSKPGLLWQVGLCARRFMLRTQAGNLRPVWRLCYELLLKSLAGWLRRDVDAAVYVGGTFGHGDPVYGVSDIDLIVVAPNDRNEPGRNRLRVKERWSKLSTRIRPATWVISAVCTYEEREFDAVVASTCFTYGIGPDAVEPEILDEAGLLTRPGLWPTREWRLVAGPDLRPPDRSTEVDRRRLNVWLELQFWWRLAVEGCLTPDAPQVPYLCVKLAAEPARMLLWLEHGEQAFDRRNVLERAIARYPEELATFERALELHDRLHLSPEVRVDDFLPCFMRLSSRAAAALSAEVADAGATAVRLVGEPSDLLLPDLDPAQVNDNGRMQPLVDWAALGRPLPGDESFAVADRPIVADQLAEAARAYRPASYRALRTEDLLVLAAPRRARLMLRGVQCPMSDPVSFALANGGRVATFPDVPGWAALDTARRAVSEHRSQLNSENGGREANDAARLAMLLSALRASLFLESIEDGAAELALTLVAAAGSAASRDPSAAAIAEAAGAAYRDAIVENTAPPARTVSALAELVRNRPAYAADR
jgi:hypothetical protein